MDIPRPGSALSYATTASTDERRTAPSFSNDISRPSSTSTQLSNRHSSNPGLSLPGLSALASIAHSKSSESLRSPNANSTTMTFAASQASLPATGSSTLQVRAFSLSLPRVPSLSFALYPSHELEVINDLFRGRVTELETSEENARREATSARDSQARTLLDLEEARAQVALMKRRVEELEREREEGEYRENGRGKKRARMSEATSSRMSTPELLSTES
ncbi:hypothetical protein K402DRAFT_388197 [Aulographum hederae CBS 113979]|uniref:Asd-4/GZF3-like helical region domain-containing protein n=1 Tax=Aulographum hederae CBS 113979 TaxID=1176131 RepID=A0A6G1HHP7_9PEZI|nr:hypothetical protein K402DRAFT_388197 [Aulographum hederae CBS 113979]